MPVPAGLDVNLNPNPRVKAGKDSDKGGKVGGNKAGSTKPEATKRGNGKARKGDDHAVAKHWIGLILKVVSVVILFFSVRYMEWVDDKYLGMFCFALLRIITRDQRKGWKKVHAQGEFCICPSCRNPSSNTTSSSTVDAKKASQRHEAKTKSQGGRDGVLNVMPGGGGVLGSGGEGSFET